MKHSHPSRDDFVAWLTGAMDADQVHAMETHVDECQACLTELESIDQSCNSMQRQVRRACQATINEDEPPEVKLPALLPTIISEIQVDDGESPKSRGNEQATIRTVSLGAALADTSVSWDQSVRQTMDGDQESKYRVGGVIAKGGMGAVLDAGDVSLRRRVAMKVIQDRQASHQHVKRFIEEAQITGQLEHPSIVPVHELGVNASGDVYYTMKLIQGQSLSQIIKAIRDGDTEACREFPMSRLLDIFSRVCDAMEFAHSKHVIHRDLKPANIMVGQYGEVLVVDWGLAKVLRADPSDHEPARNDHVSDDEQEPASLWIETDRDHQANQQFTIDGTVLGTPAFMSPEQASGQLKEVDHRTDIYALGAVLYNILTLRPPFRGSNLTELMLKVREGQIDPPDPAVVQDRPIPDAMLLVARKALAKNPDQRYQNVGELSAEINAFRGGFATSAENASYFRQLQLLASRNRGITWSIGVAACLLIASSMLYISHLSAERERADVAAIKATEAERVAVAEKAAAELALGRSQTSLAEAAYLDKNGQLMQRYLQRCPPQARDTHWTYLNRHRDERIFTAHGSAMNGAIYRGVLADPRDVGNHRSLDDETQVTRFYVYQRDGRLRCIDGNTGQTLRETQTQITDCRIAISLDGTRLAMAPRELPDRMTVLSTDDFSTIATVPIDGLDLCVHVCFTMDPNQIICSDPKRSLVFDVTNPASGEITARVIEDSMISCCHPTEMRAFGSFKGQVIEVDLDEAKVTRIYKGQHPQWARVRVNKTGNLMAADGVIGGLVIYRVGQPQPVKTIAAYKVSLTEMQFAEQSDQIMTFGVDLKLATLRLWNPLSSQRTPVREYLTTSSEFDPNFTWNESAGLVASGIGGVGFLRTPRFANDLGVGSNKAWYVDESTLIIRAYESGSSLLSVVDLDKNTEVKRLLLKDTVVRSRDRRFAIVASLAQQRSKTETESVDFVVEDFTAFAGQTEPVPMAKRHGHDAAAVSSDGQFLAFVGYSCLELLRRNEKNGSSSWTTVKKYYKDELGHDMPFKSSHLFFPNTPQPSLFFACRLQRDGDALLEFYSYDLETGKRIAKRVHLIDTVTSKLEPSGKRVLFGCGDGTIRGFDPVTFDETFVKRVHDRAIMHIAVHPEGRSVAVTGRHGLLRVWQLSESGVGEMICESTSRNGPIESIDYSPSGDKIVFTGGFKLYSLDIANSAKESKVAKSKPAKTIESRPTEVSPEPDPSDERLQPSGIDIADRLDPLQNRVLADLIEVETFIAAVISGDWAEVEEAAITRLSLPLASLDPAKCRDALSVLAAAKNHDAHQQYTSELAASRNWKNNFWENYHIAAAMLLLPQDENTTRQIADILTQTKDMMPSDIGRPSKRDAYGYLSLSRYRQGRYEEALAIAEPLLEGDSTAWTTGVALLASAAMSHQQLGNSLKAKEYLELIKASYSDVGRIRLAHWEARYWIHYHVLLKEAESLIEPPGSLKPRP